MSVCVWRNEETGWPAWGEASNDTKLMTRQELLAAIARNPGKIRNEFKEVIDGKQQIFLEDGVFYLTPDLKLWPWPPTSGYR